ncbi:hypothetical protein ABWJ92_32260 [Streptomyces sp. NPDC000609]|uniref:hypothetical protein n=1 Tax=Streptomyces sp. NPDC000609 TaxID=3160957 RepID=UPI00339820B3
MGGSVTTACLLPLDGELDVDAEHSGEDRGGELDGEDELDFRSALLGTDAGLVQPQADPALAEWTAGLSAGEGPGMSSGVPISALPRRAATSSRIREASGVGRMTGDIPKEITTVSSTVSWRMEALFCA